MSHVRVGREETSDDTILQETKKLHTSAKEEQPEQKCTEDLKDDSHQEDNRRNLVSLDANVAMHEAYGSSYNDTP